MSLLFHPAHNLAAQIDRDFNRVINSASRFGDDKNREQAWQPAVDIVERESAFHVFADLPGVDPQNVDIELENNTLTLKGERVNQQDEETEQSGEWLERVSGKFVRRFNLPDTVDMDAISAKSELGVLEVVIPKRTDLGPRKISVQ